MKYYRLLVCLWALCVVTIAKAQYDSPAYVNSVRMRANQTFNNGVWNIQRMMTNQMQDLQNVQNRLFQAFNGANNWAAAYEQQTGYAPSETDKDRWVAQNYPDVYNLYIQGKYSDPNSQRNQPCSECNGTGLCDCARQGHPGKKGTMMTDYNGQQVFIKHQYCNGTGRCPKCNK